MQGTQAQGIHLSCPLFFHQHPLFHPHFDPLIKLKLYSGLGDNLKLQHVPTQSPYLLC